MRWVRSSPTGQVFPNWSGWSGSLLVCSDRSDFSYVVKGRFRWLGPHPCSVIPPDCLSYLWSKSWSRLRCLFTQKRTNSTIRSFYLNGRNVVNLFRIGFWFGCMWSFVLTLYLSIQTWKVNIFGYFKGIYGFGQTTKNFVLTFHRSNNVSCT